MLLIASKHWKKTILHLLSWWLCIAAILSGALGLIAYRHVTSISHDGRVHMKRAQALLTLVIQHPSDPSIVLSARQEFLAALNDYRQLESSLTMLPAPSRSLPYYGVRLQDISHLLPLSIDMASAGVISCDVLGRLVGKIGDPLKMQGLSLTQQDLASVSVEVQQIRYLVGEAVNEARYIRLSELDFDPLTAEMFANFQKIAPDLQLWVDDLANLLPVLPQLLGIDRPTNYLLELLDANELRPGGGLVGNYGFLTFSGGKVASARIIDVNLLDQAFYATGKRTPLPDRYQWFGHYLASPGWSLRDSNLDADFPTTARNAELNYIREGGKIPVQGVIALTPPLIQRLLAAPDSASSQTPIVQVMLDALLSKDLQIYLNSPMAEAILQRHHFAAAIEPLLGDGVFVVDANVAGNKANRDIVSTVNDHVTLDPAGNASHYTTLSYTWEGPLDAHSFYRSYSRVYLPLNSVVQGHSGWRAYTTGTDFGRKVLSGDYTLTAGQTQTITLQWTEPGAARRDALGWHYQFQVQRQAGAISQVDLQIRLPACARAARVSGGLVYGAQHIAILAQSLNADKTLGVDYAC